MIENKGRTPFLIGKNCHFFNEAVPAPSLKSPKSNIHDQLLCQRLIGKTESWPPQEKWFGVYCPPFVRPGWKSIERAKENRNSPGNRERVLCSREGAR